MNSHIYIGTIREGYKAYIIEKGFDITYEIEEEDGKVSNKFDTLEDFADAVMLITMNMGVYRLRRIAKGLFTKMIEENKEEAMLFCKKELYMEDFEFDLLGGEKL